MTIHKALAERKTLEDRIDKSVRDSLFCTVNKHTNQKINGVTVEETKSVIRGEYDQCRSLIDRMNAIMRAVTLSNATTRVTVGDAEYTVAEAIFMKNHGMENEKILLSKMIQQYNQAVATLNMKNGEELTKRAEQHVISMYGNKEDNRDNEEYNNAIQQYITNNSYDFIDPLKLKEKIKQMQDKIAAFEIEIGAALSVSNALTEITIEY